MEAKQKKFMEDLNKSKAQPKRKKYFFEDHWDEFQAQTEFKRKKEQEEHLKIELKEEKIVKKYDENETERFLKINHYLKIYE